MIPFHMPVHVPSPTPPKPTPIPTWLPKLEKIHTIVYQTPPVEIYVTFADGPGRYQLEMMDVRGNPLRMVFDKKVVADSESWVTWDGKDDQGREMPVGQYFVVFYKDGKALRSISVIRSGSR
jgi:flagellar hook assembly protein FlgD